MNIVLPVLLILGVVAMPVHANDDKRINTSKVNIRNYEDFVSQVRTDLPVGTSIQGVKDYLSGRDIGYYHSTLQHCIRFMVKRVDSHFFVFKTDLEVTIFVSDDSGVSKIESDLIETAL